MNFAIQIVNKFQLPLMRYRVNMNVSKIKEIMRSLNFHPNSKLGQTFLIDDRIIREQLDFADLTKKDTVLEVGPGFGVLTEELAQRVDKVIAVEYDKTLYSYLRERLPGNVEVIYGDVLEVELPKFNKIVSNIPYQISSPLIFKLTDHQFDLAVFMFQHEFAQRLVAKQGTKQVSRLTVMAAYHYDIELLGKVSRTSFLPVPKVDSDLIKLTPKKRRPLLKNEQLFFKLVKVVFNERRKMIRNSLLNQFFKLGLSKGKITKDRLKEIIDRLEYNNYRPEQLSLEQFIQLSNALHSAIMNLNEDR